MQIPLQISYRDVEPSPAIDADIRKYAAKLERFQDSITGCRVVVAVRNRHQRQGRLYEVHIDLTIPGQVVAVTRNGPQDHAHEDLHVAIRDAFDAAVRQLEDRVRRRRGDVKTHEAPLQGKVVRIFVADGYGFIDTGAGGEVYFHRNSVVNQGFDALKLGSTVRLVIAEGESPKGPQASTVHAID